MNDTILNILLPIIGTAITGLLGWLGQRLVVFINQKVKNAQLAQALCTAANIVTNSVKCTAQTYVDTLKAHGEFTPEAACIALKKSIETAKGLMTDEVKQAVINTYGDLDRWLETTIEAAVFDETDCAA